MVWSGGRKFEAFKELNNTADRPRRGDGELPATFPTTWYLRLTSDGTTIQPAYSRRRGHLDQLRRHDQPDAGSRRRRSACTRRRRARSTVSFKVDWFKLTTPQTPSDEFDGDALNLCRWNAIVRHEPGGYTVGGGKLTLPAGARRLLRQHGAEQQPERAAAAGAVRAVDDGDAAHVQPERELRAGRPARVLRRRELRQGRPASSRATARSSSCARSTTPPPGSTAPSTSARGRRRSTCGSSPTGRRCGRTTASTVTRAGRSSASRRRCRRRARTRSSASTPTTATPP